MPVTFRQLNRALSLAEAHSHQWACEDAQKIIWDAEEASGDSTTVPAEVLTAVTQLALDTCGPVGGICSPHISENCFGRSIISHTTGSGRLSWRIDEGGEVELMVSRSAGSVFAEVIRAAKDDATRNALLDALRVSRVEQFPVITLRLFGHQDELVASSEIIDGVPVPFREEHLSAMARAVIALNDGCIADAIIDVGSASYEDYSGPGATLRAALLNHLQDRLADYKSKGELSDVLGELRAVDGYRVEVTYVHNGAATLVLLRDEEFPGYPSTDAAGNEVPAVPYSCPVQRGSTRIGAEHAVELVRGSGGADAATVWKALSFWGAFSAAWLARNESAETLRPLAESLVEKAKDLDPSTYIGLNLNAQTVSYAAVHGGEPGSVEVVFAIQGALAPEK